MNVSLFLCLSLLVATLGAQSCQNYDPSDLMESGLYEIQHAGSSQRRHAYNTTISNYIVPTARFETALAIHSFENYEPIDGLDFALSGGQQAYGKNLIITLFINEDLSWTAVKISYFVTSAKQFIAGFHIANAYQSSNSANNPRNLIFTNGHFPELKLNFQKKYSVAVFLTGIRVRGNQFSIEIINAAVDIQELKVIVQFEAISQHFIQSVQFSYVIYPTTHQNFIFNTPSSTYQMSGIQGIKGIGYNTTKFTICRQKGGVSCKQFEVYEAGRCVCQQGYSKNHIGVCVLTEKCPQNQLFDVLRNICLCIQNYQKNSAGKCVKIQCQPNSSYNTVLEQCECNNGFKKIGQECLLLDCPEKSEFSNTTQKCECIQQNQYINNGSCQLCDSSMNFFLSNGECFVCQQNSISNGVGCECKMGFYQNNDLCSACHGSCSQCDGPTQNQCTACRDPLQTFQNGTCIPSTSNFSNQCPEGSFLNSQNQCQNCSVQCLSCQSKSVCLQCSVNSSPFEVVTNNEKSVICTHFCGDGSKNNEEECDDGNSRANDGCFECQIEKGYACDDSSPNVCSQTIKNKQISQQNGTSSAKTTQGTQKNTMSSTNSNMGK